VDHDVDLHFLQARSSNEGTRVSESGAKLHRVHRHHPDHASVREVQFSVRVGLLQWEVKTDGEREFNRAPHLGIAVKTGPRALVASLKLPG
jgi:hypothetical protein